MDGAMDVMATEPRPVQGVALAKGLENLFVFGMDLVEADARD
jgi:hypothetical protein